MQTENYKPDPQTAEMFDWSLEDIINNPPYSHYDMVLMLNNGAFMVEGKQSSWSTADTYAHYHSDETEVFDALKAIEKGETELLLTGNVF